MKVILRSLYVLVFLAALISSQQFIPVLVSPLQAPAIEAVEVSVDPATLEVVCPRDFVQLGGSDGTDLGDLSRIDGSEILSHFGSDGYLVEDSTNVGEFTKFSIEGSEQSRDLLSVTQIQTLDLPRAQGSMAIDCGMPLSSGWFVSGEASVGTESILLIANQNSVEVSIGFSIYAPSGAAEDRVTLAPGEARAIPLAKYVVADESFSLSFESYSAGVSVVMQNRNTSGLTATGVELIAPIAEPSSSIWLPGVVDHTSGFSSPILRVFNPGDDPAVFTVTAITASGVVALSEFTLDSLTIFSSNLELPQGTLGLKIESNLEILAGVKNFSLLPKIDFGWILPVTEFDSLSVMQNPASGSILNLSNSGTGEISVTVKTESGYQSLLVLPGGISSIIVEQGEILLQSQSPFGGNLSVLGEDGYSVLTPRQNRNLGSDLAVNLR